MVDPPPPKDLEWIEKHRPKRLDDVAGQVKVISEMRQWALKWSLGSTPERKGLILDGDPGVGKTSAALALAADMGWDVSEMNASDARNVEAIRSLVSRGSQSRDITDAYDFEGGSEPKMKLFVLDEADNLHEGSARSGELDMSDKGGKQAIVELVRMTRHPVILIVNDLYGLTKGSGSPLKGLCTTLKFRRLTAVSVARRLAQICTLEGVRYDDTVLRSLANRAEGDLRSAVGDLQMLCAGKERIVGTDISSLGFRDTRENIFKVMERVFNLRSVRESRDALISSDLTPDQLLLWIGENAHTELTHPEDLEYGMELLSRADVYLGRVKRRQNYKLWGYANDMMASVGLARRHKRSGYSPYRFPNYLKVMSRTKESRANLKELSMLLGRLNHTSARSIKEDAIFRYRELVVQDSELAAYLVADAALSMKHLKYLTDGRLSDKELKSVMKEAEEIRKVHTSPIGLSSEGGLSDFIDGEGERIIDAETVSDESEDSSNPRGGVRSDSDGSEDPSNLEDDESEDDSEEGVSSQATLFQF